MNTAAHRALIVADGYYEWQKPEDPKQSRQPFYHRLPGGELFAFAGLWTTATPKDADEPVTSCSIITTARGSGAFSYHLPPSPRCSHTCSIANVM